MKKNIRTSLVLPEDVMNRVRIAAAKEDRTPAFYIRRLVVQAMEKKK